jgi:uncharacterized protein
MRPQSNQEPSMNPSIDPKPPASPRWWRVPTMWLVVGGPALVVAASLVTLALAIQHPDPEESAPGATPNGHPATQVRDHTAAAPRR